MKLSKLLFLIIGFWLCIMSSLYIYGGFKYGTARWLWRPLRESGTRVYIERGIIIREEYIIEIN